LLCGPHHIAMWIVRPSNKGHVTNPKCPCDRPRDNAPRWPASAIIIGPFNWQTYATFSATQNAKAASIEIGKIGKETLRNAIN
jgi:hypothetical protein